ncbi:hypothetical protein [Sinorhizobium fredii]|uniref:hypothetical protein n=1 Tax=Rhizobium fredii TaxID=380 RepID=UPI0005645378|nr:hypothetical protein [Sinorhizobium fredii]
MTLAKRFSVFFTFALVGLSTPASGFTSGSTDESVRIQFAVLLDDGDPISGSVTCIVGQNCRLLEHKQPELDLSLNIDREYDYLVSELNVRCRDGCSFSNGRPTVQFRGARQFDFFAGEDGVEVPLVLKPREKIGRVMLIYP